MRIRLPLYLSIAAASLLAVIVVSFFRAGDSEERVPRGPTRIVARGAVIDPRRPAARQPRDGPVAPAARAEESARRARRAPLTRFRRVVDPRRARSGAFETIPL